MPDVTSLRVGSAAAIKIVKTVMVTIMSMSVKPARE